MNQKRVPTIVVAGAAGGIGIEIVRQLSKSAQVLAIVQNDSQIEAATKAGAEHCIPCDISDAAATERCIASLNAISGGALSGLVNCAALQPVGAVEAVKRADLEKLFAVNLFGAWQLVQGLLPALRKGRGRVVLFSSMAGRVAAPMLGAYTATKFALEGMADALRRELAGTGVSISLIEPGGVNTPMAASQAPQVNQALDRLEPELRAQYEPLYRGYLNMATKALKYASKPEAVASVAVKAVLSERTPAPRYLVGADAKLMVSLSRLAPTRAFDALLVKAASA